MQCCNSRLIKPGIEEIILFACLKARSKAASCPDFTFKIAASSIMHTSPYFAVLIENFLSQRACSENVRKNRKLEEISHGGTGNTENVDNSRIRCMVLFLALSFEAPEYF